MAESRVFAKVGGVTIDGLGRSVQNFLRNMSLTVQGGRAGQGYVVQAKSDDGWRSISGTATAIEVQISDIGSGILVNVGNGQWSDKIGAGVLGWYVFAPLAVTAIVGSVKQKQLPAKIFEHVERYVASGGQDLYLGTDFTNPSAGMCVCPKCKAENPIGLTYCGTCGAALSATCNKCGGKVPHGIRFCNHCGTDMFAIPTIACAKCGNSLPVTAHFCDKCGTKVELETKNEEPPAEETAPEPKVEAIICAGCGTELAEGDVFCSKCGEKYEKPPTEKICPDCEAVLKPDVAFCSKCGHRF